MFIYLSRIKQANQTNKYNPSLSLIFTFYYYSYKPIKLAYILSFLYFFFNSLKISDC